jgi:hypothetical protein
MKIDINVNLTKDGKLPKNDGNDDKLFLDFMKKSIKILKYRGKKLYHEKQLEKIITDIELIESKLLCLFD